FSALLLRPAQRPSLFPYTTLFRSEAILQGLSPNDLIDGSGPCQIPGYPEDRPPGNFGGGRGGVRSLAAQTLSSSNCAFLRLNQIDRKSTRLNSSHVKISYAVFCLK